MEVGPALDAALVLLGGGLVGVAEIVSRYRDEPGRALWNWPAALYIVLNAAAALVTLLLTRAFGFTFGLTAGAEELRWWQVLVAGFGSMALLRSSLFTVRAGDQDVAVGPSSVLSIMLGACDRGVDRQRAQERAPSVASIMKGVSFNKAYATLPTHCLALLQNLPEQDQKDLLEKVDALRKASIDDGVKVLDLGLALMDAVGEDVLEAAVNSIRAQISDP